MEVFMGKLDIGVGDEFPVDEPETAQSSSQNADEDWRAQRAEWRRRREEWRAQRRAWKAEWRGHRDAFKDDVRRSVHENFGPGSFTGNNSWVVRVLIAIGLVALAIALLPFLFLLGIAVAVVVMIASRFHHHHYDDHPTAGDTQ
jgi:hypothetical protein